MAFLVKKAHHNGYRCSCCTQTWEAGEWVQDREVALEQVCPDMPAENEWGGLKSVTVTDGSTGEVVAQGTLSWPPGYQRGTPYTYTRWSGHVGAEAFDVVVKGSRGMDDDGNWEDYTPLEKSWSDILDELAEADRQRRLKKAEADLKRAQQDIEALQMP